MHIMYMYQVLPYPWCTYTRQKTEFQCKICAKAKQYGFLQKLQGSSGDIRIGDTVARITHMTTTIRY